MKMIVRIVGERADELTAFDDWCMRAGTLRLDTLERASYSAALQPQIQRRRESKNSILRRANVQIAYLAAHPDTSDAHLLRDLGACRTLRRSRHRTNKRLRQ